jgi:hypothetical protein
MSNGLCTVKDRRTKNAISSRDAIGSNVSPFSFIVLVFVLCRRHQLTKLNAYGISGLLLSWINAFLYGRSQSTIFNSCQSDLVPVISGVLQGSVLGPTLFLLYINDVSTIFQNLAVTCKLYADDIKLYSCYTTNCRSVHDLSNAIERLSA